ncbi:MAG: transposase [Balneolaceae bacterium]
MSNEKKTFTLDEKTKIALEASSGSLKDVADQYGVDASTITEWMKETGVSASKPVYDDESDEVTLETTSDFFSSAEAGVTPDNLNYKRLTFWSVFGTVVILFFIVSIIYVYDFTTQGTQQVRSEQSDFYDVNELRERNNARLSSFGVVDLDENIYHIPIDSAISRLAVDE